VKTNKQTRLFLPEEKTHPGSSHLITENNCTWRANNLAAIETVFHLSTSIAE